MGTGRVKGQILTGPGGCGFYFDIITSDGLDLVLKFATVCGGGSKKWTRAGLWPRLLEINKISESRVGWAAFAMMKHRSSADAENHPTYQIDGSTTRLFGLQIL